MKRSFRIRLTQIISGPTLLLLVFIFSSHQAKGWGQDGHCLIGSIAAQLLASENRPQFQRHRFDFCYYSNVPDVIWKGPQTYPIERHEHYFNIEPVVRSLKSSHIKSLSALPADRLELQRSYPQVNHQWGRAPWRIHELFSQLNVLTGKLRKEGGDHRQLQGEWLVLAGVLGHYVADLSQPLHCSENYDGQLTGQSGLHAVFETEAVRLLYPGLEQRVLRRAQERWDDFPEQQRDQSIFEMSLSLCQDSLDSVPRILEVDKKIGRENMKALARAYQDDIEKRLAVGALYLAETWRRAGEWPYRGERFYHFSGSPNYIYPPGQAPSEAVKSPRSFWQKIKEWVRRLSRH